MSFAEVDRVITTLDRRHPNITLKNANDSRLSSSDYTLPGGALDVARVYQLFEQGSTITLAFLDSVLPELTLFCRSLETEFGCPFQTNVYMTPPGAQGAKPHYDTHDVFVLQIAGSKEWTIFGTPVESPLPNQDYDAAIHALGDRTLEFELQPGDVAYIPRGVGHEARSTDTVSLHITTGILRYTWADLLLECVAGASLQNPLLRKALPPGFVRSDFDRTEMRKKAADLLTMAASGNNFEAALDVFVDRFMTSCPPLLEGQMAQLSACDELSADSTVGARPGVFSRVQVHDSSVTIDTYGRKVTLPLHAAEPVRFALQQRKFAIRDLPGNLDEPGKLTLIRRLIREGLVWQLEMPDRT